MPSAITIEATRPSATGRSVIVQIAARRAHPEEPGVGGVEHRCRRRAAPRSGRRSRARARGSTATRIAGTRKTPKMVTVAYARRATKAAITSATPAVATAVTDGRADDRRPGAAPHGRAHRAGRTSSRTAPIVRMTCGQEEQDQDRRAQGRQLGQRVVLPEERSREVQAEDPVAHVAPEQLRRLDRDEDRGEDTDRAGHVGMAREHPEVADAEARGERVRAPR